MEMVARIFRNIVDALFGNAQRVQGTLIVAGIALIYFNPGLLQQVLLRLINEVLPLTGPLLQLGICVVGILIILRVIRGGGRR